MARMLVAVLTVLSALAGAAPIHAGTLSDVVFTDTTPLSANLEMARRLFTPLDAAKLPQVLAQNSETLRQQPLDPAGEKFVLYVPDKAPPQGYALMVFVPPWQDATLPGGWGPVLDDRGMIFASAARSGNEENVFARRVPLALVAEANVAGRYRLDPQRIYVAGFSGGSRVAMRIALAYPDVFRGALLDAGSDPIATRQAPLPSHELFARFQSSRIVFVTGDGDERNLSTDAGSMHTMRRWCVLNVDSVVATHTGHAIAGGSALSRALDILEAPPRADAQRLADCNSGLDHDLNGELAQVESLITAGDRDGAQRELDDINARYGGLAAPLSLELSRRITP